MRNRPIKPSTIRYLNSAIEFFKRKHGLESLSCKIEFKRFRDYGTTKRHFKHLRTLGSYEPISNKIEVEGCDFHPRNQLVRTLFHELTHYWQTKVVKKLTFIYEFANQQVSKDYSDQSLIKDWYHGHPVSRKVLYDNASTDNTFYWFKPQEVEARKVAKEMFDEWNMPEYKGKL